MVTAQDEILLSVSLPVQLDLNMSVAAEMVEE